jgi:hypothetical protein
MSRARGVLAVMAFALSCGWAHAQESSQGIPAEVVSMLAPMTSTSGGGELRAGRPNADFPADVFPRGSTINATLLMPSRNTTVVVATAPSLSAEDLEKHETTLLASGWISTGPRPRGFTMSSPSGQAPINVCKASDFVSLTSQPRAAGGLYVRATLSRDLRRTCVASLSTSMMTDIDLPRLPPPVDARQVGGGGGGGSLDTFTSGIRLETMLSPRGVMDHYEKLLVGAGWKVSGRLRDGDDMAMVRFDVPSRIGPSLSGWLSATKLADTGDQDVFLRVLRNTRDPRMGPMPPVSTTLVPTGR